MSDTDDGFDREAAREELREKYENEREDREATARMSELLLQGATMTNQHCDRCGAPIFRHDGEAFCPQCQHQAEQTQTQAQSDANAGQTPDEATDQSPADQQAAAQTGDRRTPPSGAGGQRAPAPRDQQRPRDAVDEQTGERANLPERPQAGSPSGEAADALESSIAALARRAAAADDPRTAREYLEAAREAAEALAALR